MVFYDNATSTYTAHQNCAYVQFMPRTILFGSMIFHFMWYRFKNLYNFVGKSHWLSWMPYCKNIKDFLRSIVCQNDYRTLGAINRLYRTLYDIDFCYMQCQTQEKIIYLRGSYVSLYCKANRHPHFS